MELLAPARHGLSTTEKPEHILAIYYYQEDKQWIPHAVITNTSHYDFTLCVEGELVYHNSGSGSYEGKLELYKHDDAPNLTCKIWYDHKRAHLSHEKQPLADTEAGNLGYQIIPSPIGGNPFDLPNAQEDEAGIVYCSQCKGYHPESSACRHIKHEEGNGMTLGCGASELDFAETQTSLYRLLQLLSPDAIEILKKNLSSPDFYTQFSDSMLGGDCNLKVGPHWLDIYCEPLGQQRNYDSRFWPGIAWLHSLDAKCKEAIALTQGWIWMWQEQGWKTCSTVPKHDFIYHMPRKKMQEWLALDPQDFSVLHDKPLRVKRNFKADCANDHLFQEHPEKCNEVLIWPDDGKLDIDLTLSVAGVELIGKTAVDLYFGSIIKRNGKHISELDEYQLVSHTALKDIEENAA